MEDIYCYLCYDGETEENKYAVDPCAGKGSIKIHLDCVTRLWNNSRTCGVCKAKWNKPRGVFVPRPKEYRDGLELITSVHKHHMKQVYTIDEQGQKHGQWSQYNKHGALIAQCNYEHGKREGLFQTWDGYARDANGDHVITMQCNYVNDKRHGMYEAYSRHGGFGHRLLVEQVYYNHGVMEGDYVKYTQWGVLEKKCGYRNGKLHGPCVIYDRDIYDQKICLKSEMNYHCGKLEGYFIDYYSMRDEPVKREEGLYIKGKKEGPWKMYERDGTLIEHTYYTHGVVDKYSYLFSPKNGALIEYNRVDKGVIHGFYGAWKKDGSMIRCGTYDHGVEVEAVCGYGNAQEIPLDEF